MLKIFFQIIRISVIRMLSLMVFVFAFNTIKAQKPFVEGKIIYKLRLEGAGKNEYTGEYIFTFKGSQLKKELNMNSYQEIILINASTNSAYSLKNLHGKKYAIQLEINDIQNEQAKYAGFRLKEKNKTKKIAGMTANMGEISYLDSSKMNIYYSKDWYPNLPVTYERLPGANFLPLTFYYKDANGATMEFEAEQVLPGPVENGVFTIPGDYKIISYVEFKKAK